MSNNTATAIETIELDLPATYQYLRVISVSISEMLNRVDGLVDPETTSYNIQLAVQETCANIVQHAYDGGGEQQRLRVVLQRLPDALIVDLRDTGRSFEMKHITTFNPQDNLRGDGYGLFLIHALMDEVSYQVLPKENCWRLSKRLFFTH